MSLLKEKGLSVLNEKGGAKMIGMLGTNRFSVEVCFSFPFV